MHFGFMNLILSFYIHGSVHRESKLITVQKYATLFSLYISVGSSTCFGQLLNLILSYSAHRHISATHVEIFRAVSARIQIYIYGVSGSLHS